MKQTNWHLCGKNNEMDSMDYNFFFVTLNKLLQLDIKKERVLFVQHLFFRIFAPNKETISKQP